MELYRNGLKLTATIGLDESRGSVNVPVRLLHNEKDKYLNYTEQIHIRYLFDNQVKEEILPTNDNGFYIPGKPLSHDGPIELAVHLINGDIELVTNELSFVVKNAPNGTTQVDPSEFTWQQLVDQYVNAKLDTFANKLDLSKFEETVNGSIENQSQNIESFKTEVNANLFNQDKKITDLQNTTKVSLDSQNTKIDNFKSEVNTSLSNQNTSINQTTSAQNSKITTLESRMDTFTRLSEGSTTGDAELQDIRVGANGITYDTAGNAVRGQYSQLKEDLVELADLKVNLKNITKPEGYLLYNKKVNIPSGKYRFIFDILFSGNNKTGTIYFRDSNENNVKIKDIPNNKFVFDEEIEFSDNVSIINIWINSNATLNTFKIYGKNSDVERLKGNISELETEITNVLYKDIKFPSQGYYIGNDGSIQGNENFGFTLKMPALPLTDYFFTESCWVAEYDENEVFIKTTVEVPKNSKFTTQSNTKYIVLSVDKSVQNELVVAINYPYKSWEYNFDKITDIEKEIGSIGKTYTVGATNCDFTSVTACVKKAIKTYNSIVYIEQGEYDLIEEAKALYGECFFDNMTSDYYGIQLEHGIHLVISQNATLRFEYNGNNNYVLENVAMFAPGNGDFTIEGGTLIAKNSRYIIHDEKGSHTDRYTHKFERINMYCDNRNNPFGFNQCIGGGLGENGDIVIKDCFFKSEFTENETDKIAVSYHNTWGTVHGYAKSNIVFSGNYIEGKGTLQISYLGDYDTITNCLISNNSFGSEPIFKKEVSDDSNTKVNMRMIMFNNEIRQ